MIDVMDDDDDDDDRSKNKLFQLQECQQWNPAVKKHIDDTDRIHEESGEVGDVLPLGLDERRISVEDDVTQTMSKKRTGSERSDEVDKSDLVWVAAGTQHEDHVLGEVTLSHWLTVLYPDNQHTTQCITTEVENGHLSHYSSSLRSGGDTPGCARSNDRAGRSTPWLKPWLKPWLRPA